jgi:hypothetical protein
MTTTNPQLQRDTFDPAQSASLGSGTAGSRSFTDVLRTIIGTVLFWVYLPKNFSALVEAYGEMVRQSLEELRRVRYLSARLKYYEDNVPWLKDLKKRFDAENAGISDVSTLSDGVFVPPDSKRIISLS